MSSTIAYYNENADRYVTDTVAVDMSGLHERFLAKIPNGGLILDAGCGSGRDSKVFLDRGYRVCAFDASYQVARLAEALIGQPVPVQTFENFSERACYDGIWACASLLHLDEHQIPGALQRLWDALKPDGVLYLSFKVGEGERTDQGRHFTDATESRLRSWLGMCPQIESIDCWVTHDQRPDRDENWLNALVRRKQSPAAKLVTGEQGALFLPRLCDAIAPPIELGVGV